MAKIVNYRCENCECDVEKLLVSDTEKPLEWLDAECPDCGGKLLRIFNFKANGQRWDYNDRGGI